MDRNLFIRYDKLAREAQIKRGTKESLEWFRQRVRKDNVKFESVTSSLSTGRLRPGGMFAYQYDPKLKETLPYYDSNPLVIILEFSPNGWYGANLHYLPPTLRVKLMEEVILQKRRPGQVVSMLESNNMTKVCLKRYLANHVTSKPKEIPQEEWDLAIQLPFESFEKAMMKEVWKKSKSKI